MPLRNIRIPDPLWRRAQEKASREGVSLSEVVRRLLTAWVERDDRYHGIGNGDS